MKRRVLTSCLVLLVLSACGVRPKVVSVPQVLLQELHDQGQTVTARVLLHNFSNVEMTFSELNYTLRFNSQIVASARVPLALLVPMDSPESSNITLSLNGAGKALLAGSRAFGYQISGTISSSTPSRVFEFNYEGNLSPTPGKAGFWR
jgi:hypothetical protein